MFDLSDRITPRDLTISGIPVTVEFLRPSNPHHDIHYRRGIGVTVGRKSEKAERVEVALETEIAKKLGVPSKWEFGELDHHPMFKGQLRASDQLRTLVMEAVGAVKAARGESMPEPTPRSRIEQVLFEHDLGGNDKLLKDLTKILQQEIDRVTGSSRRHGQDLKRG